MLDDLIIETEPIDRTNLSEQEKVVIDAIEKTKIIQFDLTQKSLILRTTNNLNSFTNKTEYFFHERILIASNKRIKNILKKYYGFKILKFKSKMEYFNEIWSNTF